MKLQKIFWRGFSSSIRKVNSTVCNSSGANLVEILVDENGKEDLLEFHTTWLVDHNPAFIHSTSLQRQLDSAMIKENVNHPLSANVTQNGKSLKLVFDNPYEGSESSAATVEITYPVEFLTENAYSKLKTVSSAKIFDSKKTKFSAESYFEGSKIKLWNAKSLNRKTIPTFSSVEVFKSLTPPANLNVYNNLILSAIDSHGVVLLNNFTEALKLFQKSSLFDSVSNTTIETEYSKYGNESSKNLQESSVPAAVLTELFARKLFGCPRETFYGRMWDTAPKLDPNSKSSVINDTAYTKDALHVHTDGCYWFDMPGLQIFNCVAQSGSEVETDYDDEGKTRLCDGFYVMKVLSENFPETFEWFLNKKLRWFSKEENVWMQNLGEAIKINCSGENNSSNTMFRYNTYDLAALNYLTKNEVFDFYKHNKIICEVMRHADTVMKMKLQIGEMIVINNQRVCHGRESYKGYRNLVGCYVGKDDWISRLRLVQ